VHPGRLPIAATVLVIDPQTPTTLYADGVSKSTDGGATWGALNTGLEHLTVLALAIDPVAANRVYAGTARQGVFAIDQVAACVGNCDVDNGVTIDELLTMVNVALGTMPTSSCPTGDANQDGAITVEEIVMAVNNALGGCGSG
jgi:hypothetical protein